MYLVAGMVAQRMAGPGVVISFIIAAIASIFSGKFQLEIRLLFFFVFSFSNAIEIWFNWESLAWN